MNLTAGSRPQHLEDGDLIAYMDQQMDRARSRWAAGHLEGCAECAARLSAMQTRAGAVSAWLEGVDEPATDARRTRALAAVERARFRSRATQGWGSRPMLAAAAMVALMLTVAFGTPPGRAWVGSAAERLGMGRPAERNVESVPPMPATPGQPVVPPAQDNTGAAQGEPDAPTAAGRRARAAGLPPGMSAPVRFTPFGNYVVLQVDSRQRQGAVAIWVQDTGQAEGQIVAGRTGETLEPMPDGLRVRNTGSSRADYTITVPTRYRYIRVKIAGEPETTIAVSRANRAWLWTVNLAASAPPASQPE
jgi:anti-sigma factor RsiW